MCYTQAEAFFLLECERALLGVLRSLIITITHIFYGTNFPFLFDSLLRRERKEREREESQRIILSD